MTAVCAENEFTNGAVLQTERGKSPLSAYRTTSVNPASDVQLSFGGRDAYLVRLYLQPMSTSVLMEGSRRVELRPRAAMECCMTEVSENCAWLIRGTFDVVSFELPRAAIASYGGRRGLIPIDRLKGGADFASSDRTIASFGLAAVQVIQDPNRFDQFYRDHLLEGVCGYVAQRFFGLDRGETRRAGLATWQERRAKEIMQASIGSSLSLKSIADECGLSVGHFTRAFRQSTGSSPHKWFLERRIDGALRLLGESNVPIAEVAAQCGFVDQSHMTNVFSRRVGLPPGTYRKKFGTIRSNKALVEFTDDTPTSALLLEGGAIRVGNVESARLD